ncbi:MAG: hypothetical protein JWM96_73, partial [Alphaproteobacteria bacterium]|nr:hypothetical protein [Alphaproteobacteria bacterium]
MSPFVKSLVIWLSIALVLGGAYT